MAFVIYVDTRLCGLIRGRNFITPNGVFA